MDLNTLVREVKQRGNLYSNGEAITAIRATLETLAEEIGADDAAQIAAHLPLELRSCVLGSGTVEMEPLPEQDFVGRVALRENRDLKTCLKHVRCVAEALTALARVHGFKFVLPDISSSSQLLEPDPAPL